MQQIAFFPSSIINSIFVSIVFGVYYNTLAPSIAGGDSGELVAEGCSLGIAHPPGYPLFTLISHAISIFHIRNVAYGMNIFCALCTVLAALLICYGVTLINIIYSNTSINENKHSIFHSLNGGALFAMGMFAFSPLIWQYAITAEVFPLNTFFAAIIIILILKLSIDRNVFYVYCGAFVCGLALCNQHTILLFEAPLILWAIYLIRTDVYYNPMIIINCGVLFIIGLLPYSYLPIMDYLSPKHGSWGHVATLNGFVHHFLRRDYGTFRLFSGSVKGQNLENVWTRNYMFLSDFYNYQGNAATCAFVCVGIIYAFSHALFSGTTNKLANKTFVEDKNLSDRKRKKKNDQPNIQTESIEIVSDIKQRKKNSEKDNRFTPLVIILTLVFYLMIFHSLSNLPLSNKLLFGVHQRFWMQPQVIMFLLAGTGIDICASTASKIVSTICSNLMVSKSRKKHIITQSLDSQQSVDSLMSYVNFCFKVLVYLLCVIAIVLKINYWYEQQDFHSDFHFKRYAMAILDPLPINSTLLINYDQQWTSVRYMQKCEHHRTDVTIINLSMMTYKWFEFKRNLYPKHIQFPGRFMTQYGSPLIASENAFTFHQFVEKNSFGRKHQHKLFLSGKLSYSDQSFEKDYDLVPMGIVSQIMLKKNIPNGSDYLNATTITWSKLLESLQLPNITKYTEVTWEWTIRRDFKDRVIETAAYLLLTAIPIAGSDVLPLIEAVYWLESSYYMMIVDNDDISQYYNVLKNAGLAHANLVKSNLLSHEQRLPRPKVDFFNTIEAIEWPEDSKWLEWSMKRLLFHWGTFLKYSNLDSTNPEYLNIKRMYDAVAQIAAK
eukprot:gene6208-8552_t